MTAGVLRKLLSATSATISILLIPAGACGQDYPAKPVRVIVPFAPGGGSDITARQVAQKLSESLKQQFVVDNRGGASGLIGMELAVKSPPDGYTLMVMSGSFSATPATHKPAFDPINNIIPVAEVGYTPFVLSVHPTLPAKTAKELIALAKARPGQLNYVTPGVGSLTHLATELVINMAKINMVGIAYKSTGAALPDLLSGQVQLIVGSLLPTYPHIQGGRLRALAVTTAKRWYSLPDVPTLNATLPGYEVELWFGVMAPKNTPRPIIDKLNATVNRFLQDAEMKRNLEQQGMVPSGGTPERFGGRIRADYDRWVKVVREQNIRPE